MNGSAVLLLMTVLFLVFGYMGVPVSFALIAGVLVALFTIEQLVNGWQHGFEGPEDRDDVPQFVKVKELFE